MAAIDELTYQPKGDKQNSDFFEEYRIKVYELKQIFSKHSKFSILITEYVERCHGYEGFFTRSNVASLTAAAGQDEQFHHGQIFD